KVIVKAGATITSAAAKRLAAVKTQKTWPVKARVTSQVVYLDAAEEEQAVIAGAGSEVDRNGYFKEDRLSVRNRLEPGEVDANAVTHMDAGRAQSIGSSAGLIPFVEKNYVLRSLMGSNQQRQAVPLIKPSSPIVGTGMESVVAENTGQLIKAEADGVPNQNFSKLLGLPGAQLKLPLGSELLNKVASYVKENLPHPFRIDEFGAGRLVLGDYPLCSVKKLILVFRKLELRRDNMV
ncbi:hypothetical protein HYU20_01390, partial [Candidatus Woesearchaeota archaeon]|nr:hypothetical protein [Candidatus Woesearchaeota archaeon]